MAAEFELFKDEGGEYRWRLQAENNEIIAVGDGLPHQGGCARGNQGCPANRTSCSGK
jgi:uncharacterized protein YegP (UPF0339 family)